jgi:hypothetical protein
MALRAVLATLVAAVTLALLELPAWLGWIHWRVLLRRVSGEGPDFATTFVRDPELGYRRVPGLTWTARPPSDIEQANGLPRTLREPITFTYDRWGYRNAVDMERAELVLLGDSYVEGSYVSDGHTVAARLADRLRVPVASLGVAGYGTLQELRVLRGDALARRPRAIAWFFFEGNDLYNDQDFENALAAPSPSGGPRGEAFAVDDDWMERSFTRSALRRLRRWSHPLVPNRAPYQADVRGGAGGGARQYFSSYASLPWTEFEEQRWTVARAAFEQGVTLAAAGGAQVVLVYVPTKFRVYRKALVIPEGSPLEGWVPWEELPRRFADLCAERSLRCLDLTEPFERAVLAGVVVHAPTDTHWAPEGHALVALELERLLGDLVGR